MKKTKSYQQGRRAYHRNKRFWKDNPYKKESRRYKLWLWGFMDASDSHLLKLCRFLSPED